MNHKKAERCRQMLRLSQQDIAPVLGRFDLLYQPGQEGRVPLRKEDQVVVLGMLERVLGR